VRNDGNPGRPTVSFEELAYSNMLIVQALVELLGEKGILGNAEVVERVKRFRRETRHTLPKASGRGQAFPPDPRGTAVVVTAGDLISANMVMVETLLALLVDKGFLTRTELGELLAELREKAQRNLPRKQ